MQDGRQKKMLGSGQHKQSEKKPKVCFLSISTDIRNLLYKIIRRFFQFWPYLVIKTRYSSQQRFQKMLKQVIVFLNPDPEVPNSLKCHWSPCWAECICIQNHVQQLTGFSHCILNLVLSISRVEIHHCNWEHS